MYKNVELRKLPAGTLCSISAILETNDDWKKVMSLVPRNPRSEYFEPKYNKEHIKQIEDHARASNRKCADILFEEWGTSGRIRPTLGTLKDVVAKAGIYRAADELANMLEEEPPKRPSDGPAAPIDTGITLMMEQSSEQMVNGSTKPISDAPKPSASYGNKSTKVVKSASNYLPNLVLGSENFPDFSAIMPSENSVDGVSNRNVGFQESFPNIEISLPGIDTDIIQNAQLIHFPYRELEVITKRFSEKLIYTPDPVQSKLAGKIGSGGFGDVYVGFHPNHGHLAVKKARPNSKFDQKPEIGLKLFNAEVKFLSQLRHKNIVPILGFSNDGQALCVVCEYIDGGSLEQKLAARILTERQRINIMIGTAEGLRYLHGNEKPVQCEEQTYPATGLDTPRSKSFMHGDIKSANILLTRDCFPKLCDFGLAKQIDATHITTSPIGTSAYMAPEAFSGTITQQNDIYGYGIVLLELLTGLRAIVTNQNRETINIKEYIEESCTNNEITALLDPFIDKWTKGKEIYALAKTCLVRERKTRPTSESICETLYKISEDVEKESSNVEFKTPSPYQLLEEQSQSG